MVTAIRLGRAWTERGSRHTLTERHRPRAAHPGLGLPRHHRRDAGHGRIFLTLTRASRHPGDPTGPGTALNYAYQRSTTTARLGIVVCQIGTAFATRTDRASLRLVGVFSSWPLLAAIGGSLLFSALVVCLPPLHTVFGTGALSPAQLAAVAPFPFLVWGADELRRTHRSRRTHQGLVASMSKATV